MMSNVVSLHSRCAVEKMISAETIQSLGQRNTTDPLFACLCFMLCCACFVFHPALCVLRTPACPPMHLNN